MVKFPYRKFIFRSSILQSTNISTWQFISLGPPAGYRVLETDYTTFASVYECVQTGPYKFEYGWLLARTSTLTESQIQEAMDVYTKQGIDTKTFIKTIQNDDCHYVWIWLLWFTKYRYVYINDYSFFLFHLPSCVL